MKSEDNKQRRVSHCKECKIPITQDDFYKWGERLFDLTEGVCPKCKLWLWS